MAHWDISTVPRKTQAEVEAVICDLISRFEQGYLGRPKDIHPHLVGDLFVVRATEETMGL